MQEKIYFRTALGGVKTHKTLCFKKVMKTYLEGIDMKCRQNNSDIDLNYFHVKSLTL